jgi:hypothetical protein
MLDVHPPHHSANTWRDFLIHIATIVVGLLIAIGLEQSVEYVHHLHQRHQLQQDLREEAEKRAPLNGSNEQSIVASMQWNREILQAARAAATSGGFVTFVLPPRPQAPQLSRPEAAAWDAAKASGMTAELSRQEVEAWDRVNYYGEVCEHIQDDRQHAIQNLRAVADRLGIALDPGTTLRLKPADRDELMRAIAVLVETDASFRANILAWQGASQAALDGAFTPEQMHAYITRAQHS